MDFSNVLFKQQTKKYRTLLKKNYNRLDNPIPSVDLNRKRIKYGFFEFDKEFTTEEDFCDNYGNLLCEIYSSRETVVIEEVLDKVSIKLYLYSKGRCSGQRYFKIRRSTYYLTFNYKTKLFYTGVINKMNKKIISKSIRVNQVNLNSSSLFNTLCSLYKHNDTNNMLNIFFNRISEKMNFKYDDELYSPKYKLYQAYLKINDIKYPNSFINFLNCYFTKKEVKKNDNNLVTCFMNKNGLNDKKIKNILNKYDNVNLNNLINVYNLIGIDHFNKIDEQKFLNIDSSTYYYPNNTLPNLKLTNAEKINILKIINSFSSSINMSDLYDHLSFKNTLRIDYRENVKIKAKDYESFITEHSEWSKLLVSYDVGYVSRFYGIDSKLIENTIKTIDDITYYPILLENTDDYENESLHQKNCVRTYYKQPHNLIVSLRKGSSNSKDRATIEYVFTKNTIVRNQTLGRFNSNLDNTWDIPLHELDKFISYLYSKKMIKLPVMTTKYPNNKVIIKESKFIIDDNSSYYDHHPKWDGEVNKQESFFDLMDLF